MYGQSSVSSVAAHVQGFQLPAFPAPSPERVHFLKVVTQMENEGILPVFSPVPGASRQPLGQATQTVVDNLVRLHAAATGLPVATCRHATQQQCRSRVADMKSALDSAELDASPNAGSGGHRRYVSPLTLLTPTSAHPTCGGLGYVPVPAISCKVKLGRIPFSEHSLYFPGSIDDHFRIPLVCGDVVHFCASAMVDSLSAIRPHTGGLTRFSYTRHRSFNHLNPICSGLHRIACTACSRFDRAALTAHGTMNTLGSGEYGVLLPEHDFLAAQ